MIRSQMNGRDLEASYGGTYLEVKTRDSDDFYPIKVVGVNSYDDDDLPSIIGQTLDQGRIRFPLYGKGVEVKWAWPTLGMRNLGNGAGYFRRKAQRQFRRGVRENQLMIKYIGARHSSDRDFESQESLTEFFYPTYPTFEEAYELVRGGKFSARAFSRYLAIERGDNLTNIGLNYKGVIVGLFVDDAIHLSKGCKFLIPLLSGLDKEVLCLV
jgi:hypothetical protein